MEIVTGYKGQAHITAENWADLNRGIIGPDSYVLSTGREFESELVSNNLLKIYDGVGLIQGRQFVIPSGQSDEITIENGTQGENRTDLVVARYTKNNDTKIEDVTPVYIKGTPSASEPVLPDYNADGDIRAGDLTADMPLYALDLEGINVVAVRPLFNILKNSAQINSDISNIGVAQNYSENEWVITYRKTGANRIYFNASKTVSSIDTGTNQLEAIGLPFKVAFPQTLPMIMSVAGTPVGYGNFRFTQISNGNGKSAMYRNNTAYAAAVTMSVYGELIIEP